MQDRFRTIVRFITCAAFVATGIAHFIFPRTVVRLIPPFFPHPMLLVRISGACEVAGAMGLMIPRLRKPAAWGLIALLIAVFPANVYMAVRPERFADMKLPVWALWLRLPMQAVFIAVVWWVRTGTIVKDE